MWLSLVAVSLIDAVRSKVVDNVLCKYSSPTIIRLSGGTKKPCNGMKTCLNTPNITLITLHYHYCDNSQVPMSSCQSSRLPASTKKKKQTEKIKQSLLSRPHQLKLVWVNIHTELHANGFLGNLLCRASAVRLVVVVFTLLSSHFKSSNIVWCYFCWPNDKLMPLLFGEDCAWCGRQQWMAKEILPKLVWNKTEK